MTAMATMVVCRRCWSCCGSSLGRQGERRGRWPGPCAPRPGAPARPVLPRDPGGARRACERQCSARDRDEDEDEDEEEDEDGLEERKSGTRIAKSTQRPARREMRRTLTGGTERLKECSLRSPSKEFRNATTLANSHMLCSSFLRLRSSSASWGGASISICT